MKGLIVKLGIAVVLFAASLIGGLAATGRLNHAGTANIPLLARLFPAPASHGPAAPLGETVAAGHRGEPGFAEDASQSRPTQDPAAPRRQKTGRSVVNPETPRDAARADTAQSPPPPAPEPGDQDAAQQDLELAGKLASLTPEQINEAWQRVQTVLEELERRKGALDLREQELQELADDVGRRQKELAHERTRIADEHLRLDARIKQFEDQIKLVRNDEASALKRNAVTLSELEPNKAAELITEQWKTDRGQTEVLKLLEFIDEDALAGILELLPTSMVQDLMSKRLRVGKEAVPSRSRKQ
ncbi:MAG TPA: hypothetical protein VF384_09270 [Planctomycetota bacterium]